MEIREISIQYERCVMATPQDMEGVHHIKSLPWLSLVQSVSGSYDIQIDDRDPCQTGAGGFFIAASQVTQSILHHCDPTTGLMQNRWVFLDVLINKKYRMDNLFDFPTLLPREETEEMNSLFNQLFAKKEDLCERMSLYYRIVKILLRVAKPKKLLGNESLLAVIHYLHRHHAKQIEVSELAEVAHMSESNLYASFKRQFGTSPIAYLNHYRLTLASDLLKQTDLPVAKIAEQVGFSDPLYFSKLFHKTFRASPRQYRKLVDE